MRHPASPTLLRRLCRDDGAMSIFGLFLFATMAIVAGIAIDYQNLIAARTQLQATADLVAHAALYNRDSMAAEPAKDAALASAAASMPEDRYGQVIDAGDIVFGTYDAINNAFTVEPESRAAVLVRTARSAARQNAVGSLLFQLVGIDEWNLSTQSVYVTFRPTCLREGFVADDVVDIQSNNAFTNGFCIHSNTYVSVNSNNTFAPGTVVSMPDTSLLDLPNSGFETNDGLREALRDGVYRLRILNRLDREIDMVMTWGTEDTPTFLTTPQPVYMSGRRFDASEFTAGAYNFVSCSSNGITIDADVPLTDVVIYTDCAITFANGLQLENSVIISTAPGRDAIKGSHLQVGRNDHCATGGGARIISKGSMSFASDLKVYGGQLIALGDIEFAANADGIEGASFIARGRIDGTSNMTMGFCGSGMEDNLEADYFRLAR